MNKAELVAKIADKTGDTKAAAARSLDAVLESIQEAVKSGDTVALIGFGTFGITKKAARTGRNPSTGKPIEIAAKNAPSFKAGKTFKDFVN